MYRFLKYFKNKYILTGSLFLFYMLFLEEVDIFAITRQRIKYNSLKQEKEDASQKLFETQEMLEQLNQLSAIERFAREVKFFKKDDEDIFIIVEEE
ncbi:MAG: hypothetical protein JJT77_12960 [Crocinitomicaceae bacterium]|nr:hypothetical protein [Crocinitomicaceae bacterium]